MAEFLSALLDAGELSQIPHEIREKLEKEMGVKASAADSAMADVDRMKADYEQKSYEIDKKIIEMSGRLDSEASSGAKATARCQELEKELATSKEKSTGIEMSFAECQGEIAALKHTRDLWEEEKLSMQHLIDKRDMEISGLKSEWKTISDKLAAATSAKNEAELKLDELQNSGVTVQYHNKRLEKEKDLLTEQNKQLTDDIKERSTELNALKLSKENELLSLRGRLEVKMDECKQLGATAENLRASNSDLDKKVAELLEKVKTLEVEIRSMEDLYREELQAQVKLAELYKASHKDEEDKSAELASAVQELQKLVTEVDEAAKGYQLQLSQVKEGKQELIKENELLKKELEKANDLLESQKGRPAQLTEEDLAALSPAAAMASKFMKSGMTLTEMYTNYITVVDELDTVKLENKRLNEAMDAILEELNEKAPVLKQQREDYERALATITQLTSQMDAAALECQHLRAEADDSLRKAGRMERENGRMQMETKDLSTQVKFLLKQLEESRGRQIDMNSSRSEDVHDGSGDDLFVTSSSEVITGQLVTFRDIDHLQRQNQKLLRVVRELSDESEKRESENQSDEMKRLKESLDTANEELEKLRGDRDRQTDLVEAIVRQRDMYRVLLAQESSAALPAAVFASPAQAKGGEKAVATKSTLKRRSLPEGGEEASKALQALKAEYDEYKKEVQANNKLLNEQTDKLRSQVSELRSDNAKLQAKVDFSAEKYTVVKQSFDNARKESDMHREKNSKLLVLVQKHELSLNNVTNELTRVQQEKAKVGSQLDNARSELDVLRRTEDRLLAENASLQRDHRGQTVLLTNLQKIQQTMEKQEFEVRSDLRSRLESQENELKTLRRSNQDTIQQQLAVLQMTEKRLLATQQRLEQQQKENELRSAELRHTKQELETAKLEKQSVETKLSSLEQRLARLATQKGATVVNVGAADSSEELKDIQGKYEALQEETASLKLRLDKAQNAVQQHKDVAMAVEESLKQANTANRELSDALEERLRNASEHQTKLEQRITTLEEENRQLNSKRTSLISEVDLRTADLNRQLTSLQAELDLSVKREKESRKSEQEARDQFSDQMNLVHEAQNKYQREMLLHAESVKELTELKEKCKKHDSELETAKTEAQQSQHLLDSSKGMWEKQNAKMKDENDQLKERNDDMSKQITLLHEQVETMSNQLVALQVKHSKSPASLRVKPFTPRDVEQTSAENEDTADKSSEQLMDIVKYLRKEKNLFETKFEVAQSEGNRLKQQMTHLQKQLDETKKSLQDERQNSQASSSELSKHQALMKKVETMNVLSDSNRMLRDEKDRLQTELQTKKGQLEELKQKLNPMQVENNQFSTQIATLKSEKLMLEQDVQRWQQRAQQLLQSPRRQDPEEYRRLLNDKQRLTKNIDELNKEVTERKLEVSNLQGEIRGLAQQAEAHKTENAALAKRAEAAENEVKAKQGEIDEKAKTIMQIRRVGRRYKSQFEELQKKQQEMEANQKSAEETKAQDSNAAEAALAENNAKMNALEASLTKISQEKENLQKQLESVNDEVKSLKTQLEEANQKSVADSAAASNDETAEENRKLIAERDDLKKQLQDKEDKSKRLLTLAKTRIEQIRKEKEESSADRDRLRTEEERLKQEIEKMKQDIKLETDQKFELQSKVEELQKQLTSVSTQQQQQSKVTGHQMHHAGGAMELRKAANIRPISTRVSQVSPMRVTRTARVMPEPQQEAQEGTSTSHESLPARSSPLGQVGPSSSHPIATVSANTTSTMPTRAFVHPINPSSGHHQHVVSSMPTSSGSHQQQPTRSDVHQADTAVVRGSVATSDNQAQESSVSSVVATSSGNVAVVDMSESDQAIVSSSDDQPMGVDEGSQQFTPQTSGGQSSSGSGSGESEAAPSQSNSASSSGDGPAVASSGVVSSIPVHISGKSRPSQMGHKRTYEDADNSSSGQAEAAGSSSDAQVSVAPMSKRQRSSPDQSSAAVPPMMSQVHTSGAVTESTTRIEQAESSVFQIEVKSSSDVEPEASTAPKSTTHEVQESGKESDADTSTFTPIQEPAFMSTAASQALPTSSGTEDVIVLSSDSEGDGGEQVQDEMYDEEEEEGMIGEPDTEAESNIQEIREQVPRSSTRPSLVLQPTPDAMVRNRPPIRPAPLTPGLVQPATDDGDGIVPCTPTLPTRRHDDNYQTINSPHVPPGGPPIRFRFEDVAVPGPSFQAQGGIGSVDNTLMDFSGAGDEVARVPTVPVVASTITTITHSIVEPAQMSSEASAVSSSITEQEELEEEKDDLEGEMCVPNSSSADVDDGVSREAVGETTSNLLNTRGRRIRLIGARSRGRGGGSPSTSSQQP